MTMNKIDDLVTALKKKEEEKTRNTVLWILAIIGAVAAVAGIAYGVYRFFWKILKKILTMTLMITSKMRKNRATDKCSGRQWAEFLETLSICCIRIYREGWI